MAADNVDGGTVSVVLLSYNRPEYLRESLDSVLSQTYRRLEIILVDNLSESSERIREIAQAYPEVVLIANDRNLGFTGGMNRGLERATGEFVLLTEDDLTLAEGCVESFVEYFRKSPGAGLASGLMLNRTAGTIRSAGGFFELDAQFHLRVVGADAVDAGQYREPFDVGYVPGAMMFTRLELLRKVGGFRNDFFMYFEDAELCRRFTKHGFPITVVPAARALHFEPSESADSAELTFHKLKNLGALYLLHASPLVWPEFLARYFVLPMVRDLREGRGIGRAYGSSIRWLITRAPGLLAARLRPRGTIP